MNEKPNEWVAVADLMAGVLAVVALMLVVAVMLSRLKTVPPPVLPPSPPVNSKSAPAPLTPEQVADLDAKAVERKLYGEIEKFLEEFQRDNVDPAIKVYVKEHRIGMSDEAFDSASACLNRQSILTLYLWRRNFKKHSASMEAGPGVTIIVEGHTDSFPVHGSVNDSSRCARYGDNVGLSVARASNARSQLVDGFPAEMQRRFVVAGYGDTRPLSPLDPTNGRNRRVEVLFRLVSPGTK